jgi:hypothetical protein
MHMPKGTILRGKAMSNIIQLSKPCAFCDSRENVQLFAGLMLCGNCQENIRITNPGMFEANDQIEQKNQS